MKANITGVVMWDDNNEPVTLSRVDAHALSSGQVLGYGNVDAKGRFKFQVDAGKNGASEEVFFVVTYREKELFLSTRKLPTRLSSHEVQVHLAVPHASRPAERERKRRPVVRVGPFELDAAAFDQADPTLALELARAVVDQKFEKQVRPRLAALSPHIIPSEYARRTLSLTPILQLLEEIMLRKRWPRALRLKVDDILHLRRDDTGWPDKESIHQLLPVQLTYLCPDFVINYQTSGPDAVDPTVGGLVEEPGAPSPVPLYTMTGPEPAYIERLCYWLNRALTTYTSAPFNLRNPASDGQITVTVVAGTFGAAGPNDIWIGNNLNPEVMCSIAVHELYHVVRARYSGNGRGAWELATHEGMAVWAEDNFAEYLNRYLDEAGNNSNGPGYMIEPHQSLEFASFAYKTSLFWRYVAEQQSALTSLVDEPAIGADVIHVILEHCESGGWEWFSIEAALRSLPWNQDFFRFEYHDQAQQYLMRAETVFGNFALAAYLKELGPNVPDRRFTFLEAADEIKIDDYTQQLIPDAPTQVTLANVSRAGTGTVTSNGAAFFADSVPRFGSRYFEITVDPTATTIQFQFAADPGLNSVLCQAVLIDQNDQVREIYRSDRILYKKRFPNDRGGVLLKRIAIVVSGCDSAGSFTFSAGPVAAGPDVMITRWHSALRTEYEIDSRNWAWTWVSPDVWVDNNLDGIADGAVYFNTDNKLHFRLHNKGNKDASNIQVRLYYQDASGSLSSESWLPVCNKAGEAQDQIGLTLAAGASDTWQVDWCPLPSGSSKHFCVRVIVESQDDVNSDNKYAFSNFGNVLLPYNGASDVSFPRRPADAKRRAIDLLAIPRFGPEFALARRDLREQRLKLLEPGETSIDELRIYHRPAGAGVTAMHAAPAGTGKGAGPCRAPVREPMRKPDPSGNYATDPRALPPGLAGKPMLTLMYRADGRVTGGITLLLSHADQAPQAGS